MTEKPPAETPVGANPAPRRLILGVVCVLCLGLLGSALYTFIILSRLRSQYVSNRGYEIASALDAQARGPGRRNSPSYWQSLFDSNYETYSGSVAFLALVDQGGNVLAKSGDIAPLSPPRGFAGGREIHVWEELLGHARNRRNPVHSSANAWRIRIGLYLDETSFIRRLAYAQLAVSCAAVAVLAALSVYLLRMLRRFVEMKTRENAEARLKSLGVMAASLAHEIRNPLGAIKGLTQLAQEDLAPDDAAQSRLQTVVGEAERLERLVAGLLDFARPKQPQIGAFDLAELLSDVQALLQPQLAPSGVTLRVEKDSGPLRMMSDAEGVRQVLLNVLLNAVDASPRDGTILLRAARDAGDGSVSLRVEDAGPGLGGRDPEDFFQPFVTSKARGTGLGLAVSRQIVEQLGGTITLTDIPGGGARCSIRLPAGTALPA